MDENDEYENDPDEVDLDVDENDIIQEGEREVVVIHRMSCEHKSQDGIHIPTSKSKHVNESLNQIC